MSILIFILVLVVLIVVHELGHFIAAKWAGMRVDEFGLGYPPRAAVIGKKDGTLYTLNWLPFGGFVKIYGEDGIGEHSEDPRFFSSRPKIQQAIVLVAGVAMNILLAYLLITAALITGTPRALTEAEIPHARNVELAVGALLPDSPAATAGLLPGDSILNAKDSLGVWNASDPHSFSEFINTSQGMPVTLTVKRNGKEETLTAQAKKGIAAQDPSRYALGVHVGTIGIVSLPVLEAVTYGAQLTWDTITLTAVGLLNFFYSFFTFSADLSQVSGPVGIAGVVGAASGQGIGDLFSIMAVISINLALINLIPIPALDGGRLLFVIIESITRKRIKPKVVYAVNAVGFVFLLLLMVIVTVHDIYKLFV